MMIDPSTVKFPELIDRYDRDADLADPRRHSTVTPPQMLAEILDALANASTSCDEIGCTVDYAPGETAEELERMNVISRKFDLPDREARPGAHHVSLWRREWDDDENPINHCYASFIFTTEPDEMFWKGV